MGAGGLLMAAVWLVFTNLHGPTSVNEGRSLFGHDMHGWGLLLGFGPNVLIAAALVGLRPLLVAGAGRLVAVGHGIMVASLLASAAMDLVFLALGPPLFMPLLGLGAVLVALGRRDSNRVGAATRRIVGLLGVLLLAAAALSWAPREWSDSFGGYRIFGAMGYFAAGLLWAAAGWTLARDLERSSLGPTAPTV